MIINRMGGYTSFDEEYEKRKGFVRIVEVEENKEPLTLEQMFPKNSEKFFWGWIDPEGNTYACEFESHSSCAAAICGEFGFSEYRGERELGEKGWIKVSREAPYTPENRSSRTIFMNGVFITKKQADALFDIDLYDNRTVRCLVKMSEGKW